MIISANHGLVQPFWDRIRQMAPLLWLWTRRELKTRYRQSVLRTGWSVIQPAALLATYGWIFVGVLDIDQGPLPYLSFAWAGLVAYTLVQQSLGVGVGSIQAAGGLISKLYFPREILPLGVVGTATADLAIGMVILVALSWIQIGPPSIHVVAVLPALLMLVVWTAALTVFAATATAFRRDLTHAMPLLLRILFILTPIMYPISALGPTAERLALLNPLTVAIESVRDGMLRGVWPDWPVLAAQAVAGSGLLLASIAVVRRAERHMADSV